MKAILGALRVVSSGFPSIRSILGNKELPETSNQKVEEEFFEIEYALSDHSFIEQTPSSISEDSFEVDLDLEEQAIFQYNKQRKFLPNFDFAGIAKSLSHAAILAENCSLEDFKDTYSREDNGQILLLTSQVICLLDADSKTSIKQFNKKEVEKVIFLNNTIFFQRKLNEDQRPREVIIADRRRHIKLQEYLEQFWTNYL